MNYSDWIRLGEYIGIGLAIILMAFVIVGKGGGDRWL